MRRGRDEPQENGEKGVDFSETLGNDGLYHLFVFGGLSIEDVSALILTNKRLRDYFNDPVTWERLYYQKVTKTAYREDAAKREWDLHSEYPPYVRLKAFVYAYYLDTEWRLKHTMQTFKVVTRVIDRGTIYSIVPVTETSMRYMRTKVPDMNLTIETKRDLVTFFCKFIVDGWVPRLSRGRKAPMLTECAVCGSVAMNECGNKCGTVYCGKDCGSAHWNDSHWRECSKSQ